jgi:hypothetical protein
VHHLEVPRRAPCPSTTAAATISRARSPCRDLAAGRTSARLDRLPRGRDPPPGGAGHGLARLGGGLWRLKYRLTQSSGAPSKATPLVQEERPVAERLHGAHVVGDEDERRAPVDDLADPLEAFLGEEDVADGKGLVDDEDVRLDVDGHREREAHHHARGVGLDRLVDEVADVGEGGDLAHPLRHLGMGEAVDGAVQVHVLRSGEVRVEPAAELEERGDPARDPTEPEVGVRVPAISWRSVLFPDPLRPMMPVASPRRIEKPRPAARRNPGTCEESAAGDRSDGPPSPSAGPARPPRGAER